MTIRKPSEWSCADGLWRGGLDRIRHAEQAGRLPVDCDEHDGLTIGSKCLRARGKRSSIDPQVCEERCISKGHQAPLDAAGHALAGDGLEILSRAERGLSVLRALDDGRRKRMFASTLQRSRRIGRPVLVQPAPARPPRASASLP